MRLELGCPVSASDGPWGKLADVVVDPGRRRITHLVVEPHHGQRRARLVPVELAHADDASEALVLDRTGAQLTGFPLVRELAYLRLGDVPVDDPDWDVGVETVLAQPYADYPGFAAAPLDFDPHVAVFYDRVPTGEVEIRHSSDVFSADDHRLGNVEGFLVDADDRITHLVLERGHVFGRREVTIPIDLVGRVGNDSITLALSKDEVERLPAVAVRRLATLVARAAAREHVR
jgi:sporulation protein YlmC with PRC-barrel domain